MKSIQMNTVVLSFLYVSFFYLLSVQIQWNTKLKDEKHQKTSMGKKNKNKICDLTYWLSSVQFSVFFSPFFYVFVCGLLHRLIHCWSNCQLIWFDIYDFFMRFCTELRCSCLSTCDFLPFTLRFLEFSFNSCDNNSSRINREENFQIK